MGELARIVGEAGEIVRNERIGVSFGHGAGPRRLKAADGSREAREKASKRGRGQFSRTSPPVICNSQVGSGEMRDTGEDLVERSTAKQQTPPWLVRPFCKRCTDVVRDCNETTFRIRRLGIFPRGRFSPAIPRNSCFVSAWVLKL